MSVVRVSQAGSRYEFDVLVFGSGIAGLSFALHLVESRPTTRIALLTKENLEDSNSRWAQGGIASVGDTEDSMKAHIDDTLRSGDGLCYEPAVRDILEAGPAAVKTLQDRGVRFDQTKGGEYDLALEGGHSHRRVFRSGDHTGGEVIRALLTRIADTPSIQIFTHHTAVNLLTQVERQQPGQMKEAVGAYVLDEKRDVVHTFFAHAVVMATGGAGKVFRYTTNPDTATGDGVAMAYRSGARVGNLEFYQFHPTLLYHPQRNNFLISEALRGEGAYLRLPKTEERFLQRYEPKAMELATRDIVSRAIFTEMERQSFPFVYLDIRHKGRDFIAKHFPTIDETLLSLGIDMAKDMVPVVPGAHYWCGGVLTDTSGQSDIRRLFVLGESAFTGLHGANRLASNSLIEGAVMARKAVEAVTPILNTPSVRHRRITDWDSKSVTDSRRASQITAHWRSIRGEMNSYAGIVRTEAGLRDLLDLLAARRKMIEGYYWSHAMTRDLIELRNIALLSELIARSALNRRESRGVHFREDFPERMTQAEDTILRFNEVFPLSRSSYVDPNQEGQS